MQIGKCSLTVQYSPAQAPVKVFGIEGRYAHALYSAAVKSKQLEKVEKELGQVQVI